ncbi:hypothetical protein NLI96_g4844 [Meripilus lineatus]|uniref:RecA family profile 1 domain-containing protein n=1 Tax=Meripilus lineatus TaxID=2056292 RepID=A0AAD5V401_9APHY|nr:hypothetical protein NLI96_g4844 [Physisporinus lineatus]
MKYSTLCKPVDALLEGGLKPGFVLEISGPPGTRKEALAVNLTRTFVEANKGVIFVDLQNMTSPEALKESLQRSTSLPPHHEQLVQYLNIHTLADFAIFLNQFQSVLDANPKVWGKLQSFLMELSLVPRLDFRNILLERIKQVLTKACASSRISVAITTQLATKFRNSDGTPATSDTGSRAVMVPQPGKFPQLKFLPANGLVTKSLFYLISGLSDCVYLPNGKSYRIILVPQTRTSGTVRLLTWPTHVQGRNQQPLPEEPYEMVSGPKPSTLVSYIGVPS